MADPRTGRAGGGQKPGRIGAAKRRELRRSMSRRPTERWRELFARPDAALYVAALAAFVLGAGLTIGWTRETFTPAAGRILSETLAVRAEFTLEDRAATRQKRELARQSEPRVYQAERAYFEELENGLSRLPVSLAEAQSLDAVAPEIRERYALTEESLAAIRAMTIEGQSSQQWLTSVRELMMLMRRTPFLRPETLQVEQLQQPEVLQLRFADAEALRVHESRPLSIGGERFGEEVAAMIRQAGFGPRVAPAILARLTQSPRPTYAFDEAATQALRDAAEQKVEPVVLRYREGDVIASRGEKLDDARRAVVMRERASWLRDRPGAVWAQRAGSLAIAAIVAVWIAGYLHTFYGKLSRRAARIAAVLGLTLGATMIACWGARMSPAVVMASGTAPTVLLAVILVIAYDQRLAMAVAIAQAALATAALGQTPGFFFVSATGAVASVWMLREVRHRRTLMNAGLATGAGMLLATLAAGLLEGPWTTLALAQTATDALLAAGGGLGVAMVALGGLPLIERAFDITTSMTLIELRDPKQPLLRELAQRAPGTYTHSMTVATLVEAAADAIGADGLHAYIGALYHDVGKMNKPEYFVENQSGGVNRHNKLKPAMSLLVIVGHVKDGMELAREYSLPRSIRHYIESHHGTTLVEYFYHRAQQEGEEGVAEFKYRYPGPKPQTKEAAILMICDAVESAARALSEPTPSRIEGLVHELAMKRLMDGQFDECDLTLGELHQIELSVVKSLNSIYHARIAYPKGDAAPKTVESAVAKSG